jgi:hypothetical protein
MSSHGANDLARRELGGGTGDAALTSITVASRQTPDPT